MYAVIATGGKQYRVCPDDTLQVEKLTEAVGETVSFDTVLMIGDGDESLTSPKIDGAKVTALVLSHEKTDKVIVFKKKRRKNYRRTRSHRQQITVVQVASIEFGGKKVTGKPAGAGKSAQSADAALKKDNGKKEATSATKKAAPKKIDEKKAVKTTAATASAEKKAVTKKVATKEAASATKKVATKKEKGSHGT